ncbi:tRNA(1)(Val) (adenine(37)-N(6))-methyltransferase TrmN [Erwinia psidii]|uniref:tRNA1(Val) (adenine(37)-N6)-methyltransferase n=1 Tax=Erwinia psidii TaxID=69224 RepID=A0A3N6SAZ0_9GAMM|nr:tRNA1(Val) (adenine(37)-N6)-methyltransferase [Erwinia psidii]MCX8958113.1 tRNA1(Val) (adenine(37)-N6)-methyltransferase [Erwinia psidii]MCX8962513.1 tRNA1(Val) (adenine(37)-N6)-methyltransferase [Erwinia psidii]MCX8966354.1 tRNA1(Val) (adenine(37)-N6)-methyltransferase [Erwinia psidii]RQM37093.1 tRNA1(Val) (adenine(37)-N6)-methyltransferase [Erwinia psidii]
MSQQKVALRADGFTFKQFFVAHDRCAMKVGTDGVLLGAWAPVAGARRILDIGTGSGLIALMLAQRTTQDVVVDAVELDEQAAGQAQENAAASPWAERINICQADILPWAKNCEHRYSLIVSNPPYFSAGVACATPERAAARSTAGLTHDALLTCAGELIAEDGYFAVILPEPAGNALVAMAEQQGWYLHLRTDISDNDRRPANRVLLALSPVPGEPFIDRMTIRGPDRRYSEAHCSLTRDFYLFR